MSTLVRTTIAAAFVAAGLTGLTGCGNGIDAGDCLSLADDDKPEVVECGTDEVDVIVDCDLAIPEDERILTIEDSLNGTKGYCVTVVPYRPLNE